MEMKIANPIQTLEYLRDSGIFPFSTVEEVLYTAESIDEVIETMRKYQKIQEIVKEWGESGLLQDKFYDLINEVIEDGNDNQDRK